MATSLQHHETELAGESPDADAGCRGQGSFVVNCRATKAGPKGDGRGPAQPQSLLCGDPNAKFCVDKARETQTERKSSKTQQEEIKQQNLCDAHRGVQDTVERGGRGSIAAPSPRAPYPGSDYASVNVLLRHQQKGDISNELTMGTFLTRLDSHFGAIDTDY